MAAHGGAIAGRRRDESMASGPIRPPGARRKLRSTTSRIASTTKPASSGRRSCSTAWRPGQPESVPGDFHDEAVFRATADRVDEVDVAFAAGDHRYEGVKQGFEDCGRPVADRRRRRVLRLRGAARPPACSNGAVRPTASTIGPGSGRRTTSRSTSSGARSPTRTRRRRWSPTPSRRGAGTASSTCWFRGATPRRGGRRLSVPQRAPPRRRVQCRARRVRSRRRRTCGSLFADSRATSPWTPAGSRRTPSR